MPVITFIQYDGTEQQVDADNNISIMQTAMKYDIPGIDADCGGAAVCGTCHCYVETDQVMPEIGEQESVMLGLRPDREENSRLACQVQMRDSMEDFVVRLPEFQM